MNLLSEIISRLNQRIGVANIFDKQFGLCELNANGNDKAWIHYIGDGQGEVVTNFDAKQGTIFWAKRGKVNISIIDSLKVSGCKKMYQTTFPLTAYAVVRKSHLPCDSEDAQDWIASRVFKLTSGMDFGFKQSIGVMSYEVIPNGYANEIKLLTQNYEWACVSIDIDVQIVSSADDGCYDTCQTGDIPLPPNYAPCTPCLTEVAVDGVTITGNGTVADPLVAIGGGGGGSIRIQNEGITLTNAATNIDFIGNAVNATLNAPGDVHVNINQVQSDWNAASGLGEILNKPTIPAAQIQSDWTQANIAALDFIQNKPTIPAAQVNSDWNAVSGVAEILNKPTIPAGGLPAGGTAGQILTKVDATDYNAAWQENYADWTSVVKHTVKNDGASGTITKGTAVYVTGSNGTNMLVGRASNASEPTSSKTMGLMQSDITTTGSTSTGFVITEGLLGNLNTAGTTAGDPVWLGVNGALIYGLINKPYAPAHLVFIGIVTKVSAGNGEIFVKVQNGFELKEIHDVDIITVTPINGHVLGFDGTLWVNKTVAGWLGFTPGQGTVTSVAALTLGTAGTDLTSTVANGTTTPVITLNVPTASATNRGALSSANWSTFNGKQDALGFTPVTNARTITINGTAQDLSADRSWTIPALTVFKSATTGTVSSGTSNTVSKTQLIPAATFAPDDIIQVDWGSINKTGAAGSQTLRMYVNATADIAGSPVLLGTYTTAGTTAAGARADRRLVIKSATATETSTGTTNLITDLGFSQMTAVNIDWTAAKYFVFTIQNSNAGDSSAISYFRIMKT